MAKLADKKFDRLSISIITQLWLLKIKTCQMQNSQVQKSLSNCTSSNNFKVIEKLNRGQEFQTIYSKYKTLTII